MDELEQDAAFKAGDVVVLRSGGPEMVISKLDGDAVELRWFDDGSREFRNESFRAHELKKPEPKKQKVSFSKMQQEQADKKRGSRAT